MRLTPLRLPALPLASKHPLALVQVQSVFLAMPKLRDAHNQSSLPLVLNQLAAVTPHFLNPIHQLWIEVQHFQQHTNHLAIPTVTPSLLAHHAQLGSHQVVISR